MNVLLFTTSFEGGAGGAALRLHHGLRNIGVSSRVLVQYAVEDADDKIVFATKYRNRLVREFARIKPTLDRLPLKIYPNHNGLFSLQWVPDFLPSQVAELNPDLINLHWVCNSFLKIETIPRFKRPIVWTLHDMWPFTGGCFHTNDCDRYTDSCGNCPQLNSRNSRDLSRWVWNRKASAWKDIELTIVTPSSWLADRARSSSLFKNRRIEVIPHGLDLERYKPVNPQLAREMLNLPQDKQIILFGAWINTPLKGFHLLQSALQGLNGKGWNERLELVTFGFSRPENEIDLGIKSHYLGRFRDDISLALIYSAADVMVVPSFHESFGLTAVEALACGTPVVAFNATGLIDIVDQQQNGYLAEPYEVEDLELGIAWVLEDDDRYKRLSYRAREKAEQEFSLELQARRYLNLFNEIM
jgi:glycosyltransferase involved in cell wall biosynthesis